MSFYSPQELDELRSKADIVDVISHYIQVKKVGRTYRARCPFHDDHDPSMHINPEMQIYKCFVCGAGGNVFGFVQKFEKISFPEAVSKVADLVGFELSSQPVKQKKDADPHKRVLHEVLQEAVRYTMYELNSEAGRQKKEYLQRRGLNDDIIAKFEIGYDPGRDALYRFLHAKGYTDRDLVDANVVALYGDGFRDVFADRITFPIHDAAGDPVGFSARTIDPNEPSKYINTTETEIYVKGRLVYNAHRARMEARRQGRIYICEGVTDVIAFARAGIDNAVCTLGTSCTNDQLALIKRLAVQLVFCYDGDAAGQNATWRAVNMALDLGAEVSVIDNRTGKDPDEIIRQDGPEALVKLSEQMISWMEFYLQYEKDRTNLNSYLEKKEFIDKVQEQIKRLPDETDRMYFTQRLSELTGIHLQYERSPRDVISLTSTVRPVHASVPKGITSAEDQILIMMLKSPSLARIFEDELGYLTDPVYQGAAVAILDCIHRIGKADLNILIDAVEDSDTEELLTTLVSSEAYRFSYSEDMMRGAIRKIKRNYLRDQASAYREQLNDTLNKESRQLLTQQYMNCMLFIRKNLDEEKDK